MVGNVLNSKLLNFILASYGVEDPEFAITQLVRKTFIF